MIIKLPYLMNIRPYSVTLVKYTDSEVGGGECFTLKPQEAILESLVTISDPKHPRYNEFLINGYIEEAILTRLYINTPVEDTPIIPDPDPDPDPGEGTNLINLIISSIDPDTEYFSTSSLNTQFQLNMPLVFIDSGNTLSEDRLYYITSDASTEILG